MTINQAVVHLYDDDVTTGWIIRFGRNLSLDPDVEIIVDVNDGLQPDPTLPWWRQRVDAGVISKITDSDEKKESREWLHTKFKASKRNLFAGQIAPILIEDDQPVVLGHFTSDGSTGVGGGDEGGSEDRVFGVMFWWRCSTGTPIVPEINIYALDNDAAETIKKTREFLGRKSKTKDDVADANRRQYWKMVTYQKEPSRIFRWRLEVTAPGLVAPATCELQALQLSIGRRGAD